MQNLKLSSFFGYKMRKEKSQEQGYTELLMLVCVLLKLLSDIKVYDKQQVLYGVRFPLDMGCISKSSSSSTPNKPF